MPAHFCTLFRLRVLLKHPFPCPLSPSTWGFGSASDRRYSYLFCCTVHFGWLHLPSFPRKFRGLFFIVSGLRFFHVRGKDLSPVFAKVRSLRDHLPQPVFPDLAYAPFPVLWPNPINRKGACQPFSEKCYNSLRGLETGPFFVFFCPRKNPARGSRGALFLPCVYPSKGTTPSTASAVEISLSP